MACAVCERGTGNNSIQCTSCQKWVHEKCSGIKGSLYKVMKTFVCRGCMNPVTSTGCTSVDFRVNAKLELANKFCYFGDMLSVDKNADAAVETRFWIGWNKFRQLVPLFTNKDISLKVRGRLYSSCVRSWMLHGNEKCPIRKVVVVVVVSQEICWEECLVNDLFFVEWDVKTQSHHWNWVQK